ncbi:MAG: hypothetical protein AUK44_10550 [Porphyromonadaceae bacterium CG2_30_38_12]|nr:MAG: hypothetical protein AUK44_10550 [Porphyromonadaceae bacterium CG2_30_38_12]
MAKIYELSPLYRLERAYATFALRLYYDDIVVVGRENIPTDGHFIFAPNHRNALMDALAVQLVAPKNISTSFLARSDIFNNKAVANILRSFKIMPAFRLRDGFENLSKNADVFDQCVELLNTNHALCIMPEGDQETEPNIRPLVKGIFRIAFSLQQQNPVGKSLKIIPVGLDYGHIEKFGKHLIINIGEAIDVADYAATYAEHPARAINDIREKLSASLKALTLNIESNANCELIFAATNMAFSKSLRQKNLEENTLNVFLEKCDLANKYLTLEKNNPEKFAAFKRAVRTLGRYLDDNKIQMRNVDVNAKSFKIIVQFLVFVVASPLFLVGFLVNFLPFFLPVCIRKKLNVAYHGFFSSVQFALGLVTFPVFWTVQAMFIATCFPWNFAITFPLVFLGQPVFGFAAMRVYALLKKIKAEIRLLTLERSARHRIRHLRNEIVAFSNMGF